MGHRRYRRFQLKKQDVRGLDLFGCPVDILRFEQGVGARRHGDGVFAFVAYDDQSDAARGVRIPDHEARVDSLPLEVRQRGLSELVAAHPRHQGDPRAEPGGGHGLVRALASSRSEEGGAQDGLARCRQGGRPHDEVRVRASHHHDARRHQPSLNDRKSIAFQAGTSISQQTTAFGLAR